MFKNALFFYLTIFLSFPLSTFPSSIFKGKVIVLNAPLFKQADLGSEIKGYLRKGKRVVIRRIKNKPSDFFKTISINGQISYILKDHIKVEFKNSNELISNKLKDPTDYRLEEPLQKNYPFILPISKRGSLEISLGTPLKSSYNYNKKIVEEFHSNQYKVKSSYSEKIKLDKSGRTHFGGLFSLNYSSSKFTTADSYKSNEFQWLVELGPMISYDTYKSKNLDLNLSFSLPITYLRKVVIISDKVASQKKRFFSGFNFSPQITTKFTLKKFFRNLNAYVSNQLTIHSPSALKSSSSPITFNSLWSRKDEIILPTQTQLFFSVGLSSHF